MTHISHQLPRTEPRVNEFVVSALFATILVLAGIVSIVQFSFY